MRSLGWESFTFGWIKDSEMAIYCVVIAAVWQTTGFVMAMFLAGLRGVDSEADQRGARRRRQDLADLPAHHHSAARAGVRVGLRDPGAHGDQVATTW